MRLSLAFVAAATALSGCALGLDFDALEFAAAADVDADSADVSDASDAGDDDAGDGSPDVAVDGGTDIGGDVPPDAPADVADAVSDAADVGPDAPDGCVPSTEVCDGVDNDCDGAIDDADDDVVRGPSDCGACGVVCGAVAGGTSTCVDDACVIDGCATGRADLNGLADDGCEFERTRSQIGLGGVAWIDGAYADGRLWAFSDRTAVRIDVASPAAPSLSAVRPQTALLVAAAAEGDRVVAAPADGGLVLFDADDGVVATGTTTRPVRAVAMHAGAALVALEDGAVQRFDVSSDRFVLAGNSRPVGASSIEHLVMADDASDEGIIVSEGSLIRFRVRPGEADPIEVIDDVVAAPGATTLDVARVWTGGEIPLIDTWWVLASEGGTRQIIAVELLPGGDLAVRGSRPAPGARSLSFSPETGTVVVAGDDGRVWTIEADSPVTPGALLEVATVSEAQPALNVTADGVAIIGQRAGVAVIDLVDPGAGIVGESTPYFDYTRVALSADGDLLAARGDDGVSAAPPGAVRGTWSTSLSYAAVAVAADAELGAVLGAGGELTLLRRLAPGRWSAVSQTTLDAPAGAVFSDVAVLGTRLWVAAGRAGVIGVDAEVSGDSWTLGAGRDVILLPGATGGLQTSSFQEIEAWDQVLYVRGNDRLWGIDPTEETPEPRVLVFRSMSGDVVNTRVTGFAAEPGGARVHILDPSFGLVGFTWEPEAAEPFTIATSIYLDAVGDRPYTASDDLSGRDGWILRTSLDAGFAIWWADDRQYREAKLASEDTPWVATACPARSADLRDGVAVVVTDCGIERVVFAP